MTPKTPYLILRICYPYNPLEFPSPEKAKEYRSYYLKDKSQITPNEERSRFINTALRCDYMGSAEFEFGAVPKAFREMAQAGSRGELVETEITFSGNPSVFGGNDAHPLATVRETKTWLLCPKNYVEFLRPLLQEMSQHDIANTFRTKEVPYLRKGLFGEISTNYKTDKLEWKTGNFVGWFDLDNLWFLTKDHSQLEAVKLLLGI